MIPEVFRTRSPLASYIISTDIPLENWIHTWTDDVGTVSRVKQTLMDLSALATPGRETRPELKRRTGVELNTVFINTKVLNGEGIKRLNSDIKGKHSWALREFLEETIDEAIELCEMFINAKPARLRPKKKDVLQPLRVMSNRDYVENCVAGWVPIHLVHRGGRWYFLVTGVTNVVWHKFKSLSTTHMQKTHPILLRAYREIESMADWEPSPHRPPHLDTRRGWTVCHPGVEKDEVFETYITDPSEQGFEHG